MSLIFKVGENKDMPSVPNDFPKCGDWKPTLGDENKGKSETTTISTIPEGKLKNEFLVNIIRNFSTYMAYFEQLLKSLQTSSASSSSVTLLLFIACLSSSVIHVQIF